MAEIIPIVKAGTTWNLTGPLMWPSRNYRKAWILGANEAAKGGDWGQFNPYKRKAESEAFDTGGRAFEEQTPQLGAARG
jgi:hypothetical protein